MKSNGLIPVSSPGALLSSRRGEIDQAISDVLDSGRFVLGEQVESFEKDLSVYLKVEHIVGVASGTDALRLAILACGIGPGDEVITSSHTSIATVSAIEQTGATPVLVDIEVESRCISVKAIAASVTPRTKAIVVVHMFGQPAAIDEVVALSEDLGLKVIEDCAQAAGACYMNKPVGGFGDVAAFSFYPTKNLAAIGDAGALATNNFEIAERAARLRQYGWDFPQHSVEHGINSRLDEIQAAVLRVNLRYLDRDNELRRGIAKRYDDAVNTTEIKAPASIANTLHAMHLYVVETEHRDKLQNYLLEHGIQTARHYTWAVHQQPPYVEGYVSHDLRAVENLYRRMLTLPLYPGMAEESIEHVCSMLKKWSVNNEF